MVVLDAARCSFCGAVEDAGRRVISGPGVGICHPCAAAAMRMVDEGTGSTGLALGTGRCSFCSAPAEHVVAGADGSVCEACLELCRDIVLGDPQERNKARTALQQSYADQGLLRVVSPPPGGWD
jgi:ATP-dependent protease Clp ATPase subunit